jgi:hypothetical protein
MIFLKKTHSIPPSDGMNIYPEGEPYMEFMAEWMQGEYIIYSE